MDWPVQTPPKYAIALTSSGDATYTEPNPDDNFTLHWKASEQFRTQVFEAARRLNYFQGDFKSKAKVASTGEKTLTYRNGSRETSTQYNYSSSPDLRELTALFQAVATTIQLGRRLEHNARFDRLSLSSDLKTLRDEQTRGAAAEIKAIQPILEKIAANPAYMHLARQRAAEILEAAGLPTQTAQGQ